MKKVIRKSAEVFLIILGAVSLICVTAESQNADMQVIWSLGWMTGLWLSYKGLTKLGAI